MAVMTLRDLTKAQSDAAHTAARILMSGDVNRAEHRRQYAEALLEFEQMLVEPADAKAIVREAMRAQVDDALADVMAGMPQQEITA